jgi:Ser/Thr protein kinase RdoA (MazF antagonist)
VTTTDSETPYADLGPDAVLDAVESVGPRCDGRLLQLNSFENRVFQLGLEDGGSCIAKFYRPGRWSDAAILEEHAFSLDLAGREIPVVPPLLLRGATLHHHGRHRFALFTRQGGRSPEIEQEPVLERIGRFLGRIHAVGAEAGYSHRPPLEPRVFGLESRDFLLRGDWIPPELREAWSAVAELALQGVRQAWESVGEPRMLRVHADCHAGNLLWTDEGPHFVDFDDSRCAPAVQDLWMLLGGDPQDMRLQLAALLRGYEMFREFDPRELRLVEALRTLRLLHYSAWIARRWHDPAFPAAFPWFGGARYWQDRILELREQVALMQDPPLAGF